MCTWKRGSKSQEGQPPTSHSPALCLPSPQTEHPSSLAGSTLPIAHDSTGNQHWEALRIGANVTLQQTNCPGWDPTLPPTHQLSYLPDSTRLPCAVRALYSVTLLNSQSRQPKLWGRGGTSQHWVYNKRNYRSHRWVYPRSRLQANNILLLYSLPGIPFQFKFL